MCPIALCATDDLRDDFFSPLQSNQEEVRGQKVLKEEGRRGAPREDHGVSVAGRRKSLKVVHTVILL